MAYLDLSADYSLAVAAAAPSAPKLTAQERLVVLLSRADPLWSLRPRQTRSRLLSLLFGIEAPHRLADGRLEALRRYAVTYRLRDGCVGEAEGQAQAAGFAHSQLGQVRRIIDGARAATPRTGVATMVHRAVLAIAAALILYGLIGWLAPRFDSNLIAIVFVAVALLGIVPLASPNRARR